MAAVHRDRRRAAWLLGVALWMSPGALLAEPPGAGGASTEERPSADSLLSLAERAVQGGRWADARQHAEAAYRLFPASRLLALLAFIAAQEGRGIEAVDLARRYLAAQPEPPPPPEERNWQEARRLLGRPYERAGQLALHGPEGALVLVDRRLVGSLPLSAPILCRSGAHIVQIERGDRVRTATVTVSPGETLTLSLTWPERALLWPLGALRPGPGWDALLHRLTEAVRSDDLDVVPPRSRDLILAADPSLRSCGEALACQRQLALRTQASVVLRLSATPLRNGPGCELGARLFEAPSGVELGSQQIREPDCVAPERSPSLLLLAQSVLRRGRHKGALSIDGEGLRGELARVDGRSIGPLPVRAARLSQDQHEVVVLRRGAVVFREQVLVGADSALHLSRRRGPRPLWRLIGGAAAGVLGGVAAGLGVWALRIDGAPILDAAGQPRMALGETGAPRPLVYDTLGVGVGLLVAGVTTALGGGLLAQWPGEVRWASSAALASQQRGF